MSWWPVLVLCGSAYALKALGVVIGSRLDRETSERWSPEIVVVPVLAALIVVQTFSAGQRFVLVPVRLLLGEFGILEETRQRVGRMGAAADRAVVQRLAGHPRHHGPVLGEALGWFAEPHRGRHRERQARGQHG